MFDARDHVFRDTLKSHRKWVQQLLNDTKKTNRRLMGISEKIKRQKNGILKNLSIEIITESFPSMGKEFKMQARKACKSLIAMIRKELHNTSYGKSQKSNTRAKSFQKLLLKSKFKKKS